MAFHALVGLRVHVLIQLLLPAPASLRLNARVHWPFQIGVNDQRAAVTTEGDGIMAPQGLRAGGCRMANWLASIIILKKQVD